jgi:hypothetical protein
MIMEPEANKLT